ncbi:FAD-dependent monooxygenase [Pseudonocardia sp.]|uniref:FAD-dependent monooxygenase n=1 Tax=Pseudonocardia sp. TaxID=60912 RepID=UPI0026066BDD|nr:FAD-dependent monooxygenase [Pseudonocardia sp.]
MLGDEGSEETRQRGVVGPTSAIVCGAGIAGLAVAGELGRAGWNVTVLEQAPARREQGYMIDFFGPGFGAAEEMGLLERLRELAYDIDVVCFVDEHGREREIDYRLVASAQDGRLISLMRPDLELALFERLPDAVTVRFGATVDSVSDGADAATVRLADGSTHVADVVIGADGVHSGVRGALFGAEATPLRPLGFHTCAFTFHDPQLHEWLGTRWYLTDTMNRMAGCYALRDGRVAFFGAHEASGPAPPDARAALLTAYAQLGEPTDRALAHCPPPAELYYDMVAQVELPRWSSGRVCLVGDACQAVSLLAGQGASLAVAGGRLLARELLRPAPHVEAFRSYETRWRPVVEEKQEAGRRAASTFLPRSRYELLIRRMGLRLLQWPVVGRLISARLVGTRSSAGR